MTDLLFPQNSPSSLLFSSFFFKHSSKGFLLMGRGGGGTPGGGGGGGWGGGAGRGWEGEGKGGDEEEEEEEQLALGRILAPNKVGF